MKGEYTRAKGDLEYEAVFGQPNSESGRKSVKRSKALIKSPMYKRFKVK